MTEPGLAAAVPTSGDGVAAVAAGLPLTKPDGTPMTVVVTGSVPGLDSQ